LGLRIGLFSIELGTALWSHSLSLLAGAGHLFADLLTLGTFSHSPFEEDVYHALKHHPSLQQYTIRTQVGCSGYRIDLAIAHNNRPGEFLLGIECDGASYHSSPTARDRDRLRQQILEKLGWKIHRIWSTEWFRNKPEQVRLLVDKIQQLQ
jgi:very-short-patch-repair endonuclease